MSRNLQFQLALETFPSDNMQRRMVELKLTDQQLKYIFMGIIMKNVRVTNSKESKFNLNDYFLACFEDIQDFQTFKTGYQAKNFDVQKFIDHTQSQQHYVPTVVQNGDSPPLITFNSLRLRSKNEAMSATLAYENLKKILFNYNLQFLSLPEINFVMWYPIIKMNSLDISNISANRTVVGEQMYFSTLVFNNIDVFLENQKIIFQAACGNGKTFVLKQLVAFLQSSALLQREQTERPPHKYFIYIAPGRQLTLQTFIMMQDISKDKEHFGFDFPHESIDSIYYADEEGNLDVSELENVLVVVTPHSAKRLTFGRIPFFKGNRDTNFQEEIIVFMDEIRQILECFKNKDCHQDSLERYFSDLETIVWMLQNCKVIMMGSNPGYTVENMLRDIGIYESLTIFRNTICPYRGLRFSINQCSSWDIPVTLLCHELNQGRNIFWGVGSKNLQRRILESYHQYFEPFNMLQLNGDSSDKLKNPSEGVNVLWQIYNLLSVVMQLYPSGTSFDNLYFHKIILFVGDCHVLTGEILQQFVHRVRHLRNPDNQDVHILVFSKNKNFCEGKKTRTFCQETQTNLKEATHSITKTFNNMDIKTTKKILELVRREIPEDMEDDDIRLNFTNLKFSTDVNPCSRAIPSYFLNTMSVFQADENIFSTFPVPAIRYTLSHQGYTFVNFDDLDYTDALQNICKPLFVFYKPKFNGNMINTRTYCEIYLRSRRREAEEYDTLHQDLWELMNEFFADHCSNLEVLKLCFEVLIHSEAAKGGLRSLKVFSDICENSVGIYELEEKILKKSKNNLAIWFKNQLNSTYSVQHLFCKFMSQLKSIVPGICDNLKDTFSLSSLMNPVHQSNFKRSLIPYMQNLDPSCDKISINTDFITFLQKLNAIFFKSTPIEICVQSQNGGDPIPLNVNDSFVKSEIKEIDDLSRYEAIERAYVCNVSGSSEPRVIQGISQRGWSWDIRRSGGTLAFILKLKDSHFYELSEIKSIVDNFLEYIVNVDGHPVASSEEKREMFNSCLKELKLLKQMKKPKYFKIKKGQKNRKKGGSNIFRLHNQYFDFMSCNFCFRIRHQWQSKILKEVGAAKSMKNEDGTNNVIVADGFDIQIQNESVIKIQDDKFQFSDVVIDIFMNLKCNEMNKHTFKLALVEVAKMNSPIVSEEYKYYNRNFDYNTDITLLDLVVDKQLTLTNSMQNSVMWYDRETKKFTFKFNNVSKCFCGEEFETEEDKLEHVFNEHGPDQIIYCPICDKIVAQEECHDNATESENLETHLETFHDCKCFDLVQLCLTYVTLGICFHPIMRGEKSPNCRHSHLPSVFSSSFWEDGNSRRIGLRELTPKTSLKAMLSIFKDNVLMNLALITGMVSDLTVIDIDFLIKLSYEQTIKILNLLFAKVPSLRNCLVTVSCSNGLHFGFCFCTELRSSSTSICQLLFLLDGMEVHANVDIRSESGIIIAPLSAARNKFTNEKGVYKMENLPTRKDMRTVDAKECLDMMQSMFPCPFQPEKKRKFGSKRKMSALNLKSVTCRATDNDLKLFAIAKKSCFLLKDLRPTQIVNVFENGTRKIELRNKHYKRPRSCPIINPEKHDSSSGYGCGAYIYVLNCKILYRCYSGKCKNDVHEICECKEEMCEDL